MLFFCSADTYKLIKCTVSDSLGVEAWKWLQQYRYSLIWSYLLIIKATFHICKLSWLIQTFMNLHLYFVNRLRWFLHCSHCVLCHWNLNVVFSFHNHVDYSTQFVKLEFWFLNSARRPRTLAFKKRVLISAMMDTWLTKA